MLPSSCITDHCILILFQLEGFQVLADELLTQKVVVQDLRKQVTDYETMIRDYSARYSKELGEAAIAQNEQQMRIEQLQSQVKQLQHFQSQTNQLQQELELVRIQVRESAYMR